MKYPSVYLDGKGARGTMLSIAFAGANQIQDTGAKMIHNAPNTSSSIVSKSIAKDGGEVNYRGQVTFGKDSAGSISPSNATRLSWTKNQNQIRFRLTKSITAKCP